jgi:hypothetical protein
MDATEEVKILGRMGSVTQFHEQYLNNAKRLNDGIHQFQQMCRHGRVIDSSFSDMLSALIITILVIKLGPDNEAIQLHYTGFIISGLSSISLCLFIQPRNTRDPLNVWILFQNVIINSKNISDAMLKLADLICVNMLCSIESFQHAFRLLFQFFDGLVIIALQLFACSSIAC